MNEEIKKAKVEAALKAKLDAKAKSVADAAAVVAAKEKVKEDARLLKASEERNRIEDVKKEKDFEAHVLTIGKLKERQKFLDALYLTLKEENINSISDLENKQAKAQRDTESEIKKVI